MAFRERQQLCGPLRAANKALGFFSFLSLSLFFFFFGTQPVNLVYSETGRLNSGFTST